MSVIHRVKLCLASPLQDLLTFKPGHVDRQEGHSGVGVPGVFFAD